MRRSWILITVFAAGCGSGTPPAPSPGGGSPTAESITGRERIGWNQQAAGVTELATFRYAIYVDGTRSEIADASCSAAPDATGFPCSGKLPPMANGIHTLELATFVVRDDGIDESSRSSALRVSVSASTAPAVDQWIGGEAETTRDGLTLRAEKLAEGLNSPVDAAFAGDGRLFIAERAGAIRIFADARLTATAALRLNTGVEDEDEHPQILSVAVDPDFTRTHFVFVVQTAAAATGPVLRLARYRELRGTLAERAVLFETPAPSAREAASAVARFGSDGKIYLAFAGDGSGGRLVRLSADGTMPRDQAGTTPAIATGIEAPRGLDWHPRSGILWIADDGADGAHVSGLSMSPPPVRAIVRARRAVLGRVGSLAFYRSDALQGMRGDALLGSAEGYIIRLRFANDDPTRVEWSERLFDRGAGPIRVVAVSPDGAIYFCTSTALGRLTPAR